MARTSHHVLPAKTGGWNIKKSGAARSSAHTCTKTEAIEIARKISKNQHTELIIHSQNGKIQRCDNHGNDPCPPKDKK